MSDVLNVSSWRKSSRSNTNGACVETAAVVSVVAVRDSKLDTTGDFPTLVVPASEWSGLLSQIRSGALDI